MARRQIPVYDICSLHDSQRGASDLLIEPFGAYLQRHYEHLHTAHRHSFYHFVLFTKGAGTHSIDFTEFEVKPWQVYFMAPGQVHGWNFSGKTDGFIVNFAADYFRDFLLAPDYLSRFHFFGGDADNGICQLPVGVRELVKGMFEELLVLNEGAGTLRYDRIRVQLLQFFLLVEASCGTAGNGVVPHPGQLIVQGYRKLIDQHFIRLKLPKDYAKLLSVTPNHLNAVCRELLGKTAGEMIRDRLLLESKRLLVNAGMTVREIAYELDFRDNSYFGRFFKKYTGQTPEEFRKRSW
ncbi:MAG: AraC family transcriptional regulator [Chitinophagaceae bacterium]|nr:MAG: AraC family transcriptional regulator [Chitinophagaceae bacterium]